MSVRNKKRVRMIGFDAFIKGILSSGRRGCKVRPTSFFNNKLNKSQYMTYDFFRQAKGKTCFSGWPHFILLISTIFIFAVSETATILKLSYNLTEFVYPFYLPRGWHSLLRLSSYVQLFT